MPAASMAASRRCRRAVARGILWASMVVTFQVGTRSLSSGRPRAGPVGFAHPTGPRNYNETRRVGKAKRAHLDLSTILQTHRETPSYRHPSPQAEFRVRRSDE